MGNDNFGISNLKLLQRSYEANDFNSFRKELLKNKSSMPEVQFHYNFGISFLASGQTGNARLHLEKAFSKGMRGKEITLSLKKVKKGLDQSDIGNSKEVSDLLINFLKDAGPAPFISPFLLSLVIILGLAAWKKFKRPWVHFLILITGLSPLIFFKVYLSPIKRGVFLKDSLIYNGPSKILPTIAPIEEGSKVLLKGTPERGWARVVYPVSLRGWIQYREIGIY